MRGALSVEDERTDDVLPIDSKLEILAEKGY